MVSPGNNITQVETGFVLLKISIPTVLAIVIPQHPSALLPWNIPPFLTLDLTFVNASDPGLTD